MPTPTRDADGLYPSDQSLRTIEKWDLLKHPVSELLDFVEPLWEYSDRFIRHHHNLYLSTGGWSGNESIIGALQHNFIFWSMYWFRSQRGGHYWFNTSMCDKKMEGFIKRKRARRFMEAK